MKPRSSTTTATAISTTDAATVIDDPCWGDPEHCSLEYLLSKISRTDTILFDSKDYILMHKPADLRMDGPYPATVHKLITYWYPPPSLRRNDNDTKNADTNNNDWLLQQLQDKHRHSDVKDNEWRPCHQLDYATSGVLLLAQSAKAAHHACTMFEHRRVNKAYMAVLHGHVCLGNDNGKDDGNDKDTVSTSTTPTSISNSMTTNLPVVCSKRVQRFVHDQELQYRRLKQRKRSDTFQGYQPPNAVCQILKGRHDRLQGTAIRKRKRNERLSDAEWVQVEAALQLEPVDHARVANLSWKQIRLMNKDEQPNLKEAIERATECYNTILRTILEKEAETKKKNKKNNNQQQPNDQQKPDPDEELPPVFRVQGEAGNDDNNNNIFYVYMAMAQVADEFAMRIPATTAKRHASSTWLLPGDENVMNFKVALTKCTIIEHATLRGHPVTKVKLEPRTGRRHQLRVHTAFVGHPIVGDQTYECHTTAPPPTMSPNNSTPSYTQSPSELSPRMCLHAFSLGLPMPTADAADDNDDQQRSRGGKGKEAASKCIDDDKQASTVGTIDKEGGPAKRLFATAPDPFTVSKNGELTISDT